MIQKSVLKEIIREVLAENPDLSAGTGLSNKISSSKPVEHSSVIDENAYAKTENTAGVNNPGDICISQDKPKVAYYLALAREADKMPDKVLERADRARIPYEFTKQDFQELIYELENTWSALVHAEELKKVLDLYSKKYCLKKSLDI
ncbi:MAG: diol dehydratase small subunit [Bacillota bacterium]